MHRIYRIVTIGLCFGALVAGRMLFLEAAERAPAKAGKPAPTPVELFSGMSSGELQVKFIPKNDQEASLVIQNRTKQPLSVKLPDAFVGVPVLAQVANAGGNRTRTTNNGNNGGGGNQAVGGGLGGGGGGNIGGGGGGFFNVAPEGIEKLKVSLVCLEHGKNDPAVRIPYEIRPVDTFTKDGRVKELLTMMGNGSIDQRAAQAAAWHFTNKMSFQELATKKIHHLGGRADEQYFSPEQMQMAARVVSEATRLAALRSLEVKEEKPADGKKPAFRSPGEADPAAPKESSTASSSGTSTMKK